MTSSHPPPADVGNLLDQLAADEAQRDRDHIRRGTSPSSARSTTRLFSGPALFCVRCEQVAAPRHVKRGSFLVEFACYFIFFLPGILYGLWRTSSRHAECSCCGSEDVIPTDSPRARRMLAAPR